MEFKPITITESEARTLVSNNTAALHDLIPAQVKELFVIRHFKDIENKAEIEHLESFKNLSDVKAGESRLLHFPWHNLIIRTVGPEDYFTLKTNRNRDLISEEEQQVLSKFTVAVFGLSVGSNIAFLLTQAGISNKIFLADPDTLDTTNLNRLLTGVQDIGLNKAIISARKICEGNPYAEPVPMTEGIDDEKLEALLKKGDIHCIVEEVDSLPIKISTRRLAMKHKVPVVMITDNGFSIAMHVERYDLGHALIFEKEEKYWEAKMKGGLTHQQISQIIIEDIFGSLEKVDKKLFASNLRIMKKRTGILAATGKYSHAGRSCSHTNDQKDCVERIQRTFHQEVY